MLGLIADSVIEDFLVVLEQDFNPSKVVVAVSGAEAQAALRQASVDNHAVVLEPGRLPEDHSPLTLLRSGSGKTKMLGLPVDQAGAGSDSSGLE